MEDYEGLLNDYEEGIEHCKVVISRDLKTAPKGKSVIENLSKIKKI